MHEFLLEYIKTHSTTPLTETETEVIRDVFIPKKIRKRQFLLQEGEVCRYAAFLVKGAMRQYSVDDKGVEQISRLFIENWWVSDRESYVRHTPSVYNIDAWENSEVLLVARADYLDRLVRIPAFIEMTRKKDDNFAIETQHRVSVFFLSAEKRYAEFVKTHPEFLQRFPQHIIASYLCLTKETLSRIRSNTVKKLLYRSSPR